MDAVLPALALVMFVLVGIYGWRIFAEPRPLAETKPTKRVRRRRHG